MLSGTGLLAGKLVRGGAAPDVNVCVQTKTALIGY